MALSGYRAEAQTMFGAFWPSLIQIQKKELEVQLASAKLEQQQQICRQLSAKNELLQQANDQLSKAHEIMKVCVRG